jgi:FtsZ-binding cell division protein ZapB
MYFEGQKDSPVSKKMAKKYGSETNLKRQSQYNESIRLLEGYKKLSKENSSIKIRQERFESTIKELRSENQSLQKEVNFYKERVKVRDNHDLN